MLASLERTTEETETVLESLNYTKIASIIRASDRPKEASRQEASNVTSVMVARCVSSATTKKKKIKIEENKALYQCHTCRKKGH